MSVQALIRQLPHSKVFIPQARWVTTMEIMIAMLLSKFTMH